ncbi:MAG: NAD-dependent epimerase/dehydratase family protein [Candidatus Omnitrophica bacterium]|nr:NAD-dependent epimerase/dehydratase family protein [Candidatus Omnitrophota bacterium]
MKKKVLITGVNGFIGQALWQYLRKYKKSIDVYGIARAKKSNHPNISVLDVLNPKKLEFYLNHLSPDYIFHLAGGRMNDFNTLVQSNIGTTKVLLTTLQRIKCRPAKIIIAGSVAEYGIPLKNSRGINERYVAKPLSNYGRVKLKQTKLSLKYASQDLPIVVARISNISGTNTPEQLAAGSFSKEIVSLEKGNKQGTLVTMNLKGRRDFLDIHDVCSALWCLAEHGKYGHIYNVCSAVPVIMEDILFKLISFSKIIDVEICENENSGSESFDVIGSNAKLRKHTSWKQEISLDESLRDTLKSWRKKLNGKR